MLPRQHPRPRPSVEVRALAGWDDETFSRLAWFGEDFELARFQGFDGDARAFADLQADLETRLAAAPPCPPPGQAHPDAVDPGD